MLYNTEDGAPYRPANGETNVYNRDELYSQIWAEPMTEVAKKYGVSDVAIRKVCKKLNIPIPPRGYWAKKRAGQKVETPPLPKLEGSTFVMGYRSYYGTKKRKTVGENILDFLPPEDRQEILDIAQHMDSFNNLKMHPVIVNYMDMHEAWEKQQSQKGYRLVKSYNDIPMYILEKISEAQLPRTYRLLSTLFYAVEQSGGQINKNLTLRIRGEDIGFEIHEIQDVVDHILTAEEKTQLQKYESGKSFSPKPTIRKHDYVYTGRLCIYFRGYKQYRDTVAEHIEAMLGDLLINAYEAAENQRINKLASGGGFVAQVEEQKPEEYNTEVDRTVALVNQAEDYQIAQKIRAYVQVVESRDDLDAELLGWIEWANNKADWFDPSIARKDEFFGIRQHEKSREDKRLKHIEE